MSAHDAAVCAGGEAVDQGVDGAEHQQRPGGAEGEQTDVKEVEQLQQFAQHGEGCRHMDARRHQGQEEYQQHLTADGGADLPGTHAHLLHDLIAALVLISLGNLLVVDDEYRGQQEQQPQKHAQEQEAAVHGVQVHSVVLMADDGVHVIGVRRQQGVHKGQLFLFRAVQVHLDTKFPVDSAGIPVADGGDYGLIRHHQEKLRRLMQVPDGYRVLLLQTGASGQFSMIPLNLMGRTGKADYAVTGNFSSIAMKEAKKYGTVNIAADSGDRDHSYIPAQDQLKLDPEASYFYYCANNTIYGTEWQYVPETGNVPLVCDMSSDILSRPVDLSKFGIVYAGAQKNMAPAGLTVVIIREDLAGHELPFTPLIMNYQTMIEKDSMYNTPPCWCIYMLGLTLDWVEEQGGLAGMEKLRTLRSSMLYDTLDNSRLFRCHAEKGSRSGMNVTFRTGDEALDAKFVAEAAEAGFVNLKGHRKTGGMRASIYNAMPVEGVERLCQFIREFDRNN